LKDQLNQNLTKYPRAIFQHFEPKLAVQWPNLCWWWWWWCLKKANQWFVYARFDVFIVMKVSSLHPEDGGSMALRNVGILPQPCTVSQLRRRRLQFWCIVFELNVNNVMFVCLHIFKLSVW